jgi:hypothetical protein
LSIVVVVVVRAVAYEAAPALQVNISADWYSTVHATPSIVAAIVPLPKPKPVTVMTWPPVM